MISPLSPALDDRLINGSGRRRFPRRLIAFIVLGLLAGAAGFAFVLLQPGDGAGRLETATDTESPAVSDDPSPGADSSVVTEAETTTTSTIKPAPQPAAPVVTAAPVPDRPGGAIWPRPGFPKRHLDPISVARSFIEDYIGFEDHRIGHYQWDAWAGGEVEFRPYRDGPVTVVLVDQVRADGSWWVFGARSEHIRVAEPIEGAVLGDLVHVLGDLVAESGTLEIEIRADNELSPILTTGIATGGGEDRQWFEGGFGWREEITGSGAVLFVTRSADDDRAGEVLAATAVRVHFS